MTTIRLLLLLVRLALLPSDPAETLSDDTIRATAADPFGKDGAALKAALSPEHFPPEAQRELYALAARHDLAHLAAYALDRLGVLEGFDNRREFEKQWMTAVYRYARLESTLNELCTTFENAKIPFLPLKGAVLRRYYPEPWMRTSCDIDILVKKEDADRAADLLVGEKKYRCEGKNSHDFQLFSPADVHVELHYLLIEEEFHRPGATVLADVWQTAFPVRPGGFRYEMTDEMFYLYHLAHMAKHFTEGGCGIRPFVDLWILSRALSLDPGKMANDLSNSGLERFATAAEQLSRCWMADGPSNELCEVMENYLLRGGVYGTIQNRVAVHQRKEGGKFRYALSRIFLPYDSLKYAYPILQKHKWLLPVMEVRRWGKLIFCGGLKRSVNEFKVNGATTQGEKEAAQYLLDHLGL